MKVKYEKIVEDVRNIQPGDCLVRVRFDPKKPISDDNAPVLVQVINEDTISMVSLDIDANDAICGVSAKVISIEFLQTNPDEEVITQYRIIPLGEYLRIKHRMFMAALQSI